ncbi:MAG: M20/M25/M40 family metallo-hydrolase [Bacteroidia bacterium]|nr:M20/M25/M40 family metallo-hydrolase [Bacteroidia bacterium]MCZ2248977.1 M20/M25/M40 family metallo-hydrolase [Bacteroidia bacterium]
MRKITLLCFVWVTAFNNLHAQQIEINKIKSHITFLASDELKGRGTGTEDELKAANYIAEQFKDIKLIPKGEKGTYLQKYEFTEPANPHATVDTNGRKRELTNVIGYLDNKAAYTIIIGAHYDHLGLGHDGNSLDANPKDKIHNGADDNASGTAGVIELARYYANNNIKEAYNFLFICFSGEELGLFGSKKYCENPAMPLTDVNMMINMDMVGRLEPQSKKLMVYGVGTAPEFVDIISSIKTDMNVMTDSSGVGPSDHTSFYLKDIPVLHFFTGQHSDYHKPGDDTEKINFEGEEEVLQFIISIISQVEKLPKLKFLKTRSSKSDTPAFKVTLGIMPDYMFGGVGVHVDGVTDGKPAHKAGLKQGDVIVKLGEYTIKDMQSYMEALSKFKKGDTTTVQVLRGNDLVEGKITF